MSRPFIPAPDCARVELIYLQNGQTCENTFSVKKGSPYTASDLATLRGLFDTWDNATWKNTRHGSVTLVRIRSRGLDSASSPVEDYSLPTPRAGTQTGTLLPNNVTYSVKLATGLAGRSQRGRIYMVGMTTGNLGATSNQLSSAAAAIFVADLNTLLSNLASAGHTLGVISYRTDKAWRSTAQFTPATGWVQVDLNFDSQRRRLTGRGI